MTAYQVGSLRSHRGTVVPSVGGVLSKPVGCHRAFETSPSVGPKASGTALEAAAPPKQPVIPCEVLVVQASFGTFAAAGTNGGSCFGASYACFRPVREPQLRRRLLVTRPPIIGGLWSGRVHHEVSGLALRDECSPTKSLQVIAPGAGASSLPQGPLRPPVREGPTRPARAATSSSTFSSGCPITDPGCQAPRRGPRPRPFLRAARSWTPAVRPPWRSCRRPPPAPDREGRSRGPRPSRCGSPRRSPPPASCAACR